MTQDLFTKTIEALKTQNDIDVKRAGELSSIYGADINPNDNKTLIDALFLHLENAFSKDSMHHIDYFCFQQDFGRLNNTTVDDLWKALIMEIEVVDEIDLSAQKPYPYRE